MSSFLRTGNRRNGKPWVTVLPMGKSVEMISGARLYDALLLTGDANAPHCGGRSRCALCHVIVLEGARGLSKASKEEREQLAQMDCKGSQSRLSCQAFLGNHKVTIELVNH